MTRVVDGLVTLGPAVRAPHPDSARAVRIEATQVGSSLMTVARARRITALAQALEALPATDRRLNVAAVPLTDHLATAIGASGNP